MTNTENTPEGERIAKVLARAGVGSRRDIERMIAEGRIQRRGITIDTPATFITDTDGITVDGQAITAGGEARIWRLNKPKGWLTTHRDPGGRPTVFENMPNHMPRVISVGRLDMNTEGLLLLTNDGALARYLELPDTGLARRYRVRVHGRVTEAKLASLKDGATVDGIHYGPVDAKIERITGTNAWLAVTIYEGKNREVRKLMEHLDLQVNRLVRTNYGPFSLGNVPLGGVEPVPHADLRRALPEFFKDRAEAADSAAVKSDPSKWAKSSKQKKIKPGYKARRKPQADDDDGTTRSGRGDRRGNNGQNSGTKTGAKSNSGRRPVGDKRTSASNSRGRTNRPAGKGRPL